MRWILGRLASQLPGRRRRTDTERLTLHGYREVEEVAGRGVEEWRAHEEERRCVMADKRGAVGKVAEGVGVKTEECMAVKRQGLGQKRGGKGTLEQSQQARQTSHQCKNVPKPLQP